MTFKPAVWYPISAVLSVLNLASVWFAAVAAEPFHATIHAVLGVGFGLWAQRLRNLRAEHPTSALQAGLEPIAMEVDQLRQELIETQERLDFAERLLTQSRDPSGGQLGR